MADGGVTLRAICDRCRSEQIRVQAPTAREANAEAARRGWRRRRDNADVGPNCVPLESVETVTGWGKL
jgi:hypothetical protein